MTTLLYIIGYFILLLYLPKIADTTIVKALPLMYFGIFYYYMIVIKKQFSTLKFNKNYNHIYFSAIILTVGLFRTNKPDVDLLGSLVKVLSFLMFLVCTSTYATWYAKKYRGNFIKLFLIVNLVPFVLYCLVNVIFWMLGVTVGKYEETNIGSALMLSQFGIQIERVRFPLATGFNSFAALLGGLFVVSTLGIRFSKIYKYLLWLGAILYFSMLLLIDSRAAIIYPAIIFVLVTKMYNRNRIDFIRFLPVVQVAGPILLVFFLQFAASNPIFESFSRSSEDLQTGNSRSIIWGISLAEFLNFKPEHLAGYGEYGHYASGASSSWAPFFGRYENSELMHPHNTIFMILFDYGFLGLIVYFFLLNRSIKMVRLTWSYNREFNSLIIGYIMYFLILGITESFFGFYYLNSYYLLFSILIVQAASIPFIAEERLRQQKSPLQNTISQPQSEVTYAN